MIGHPDFVRYPAGTLLKTPAISEKLAYRLRLKRSKPLVYPAGLVRLSIPLELRFDLAVVSELANHASRSIENRPSMAQWHDRTLWKDGTADLSKQDVERFRGRHIDTSKIPPALDLVKDHGIYLMSNGIPVQRASDGRGSKVAYAEGFDPFQEPEWHEKAHLHLGRRDFSIPVPLSWVRHAQSLGKTTLTLIIDRQGLQLR